jgi:hypothetical protein
MGSIGSSVQTGSLGPTQPIQCVPGALFPGTPTSECESDHCSPASDEVKNACSYTSTPSCVFMTWRSVKHKDNFAFNSDAQ